MCSRSGAAASAPQHAGCESRIRSRRDRGGGPAIRFHHIWGTSKAPPLTGGASRGLPFRSSVERPPAHLRLGTRHVWGCATRRGGGRASGTLRSGTPTDRRGRRVVLCHNGSRARCPRPVARRAAAGIAPSAPSPAGAAGRRAPPGGRGGGSRADPSSPGGCRAAGDDIPSLIPDAGRARSGATVPLRESRAFRARARGPGRGVRRPRGR